jgi:hypothetical protein
LDRGMAALESHSEHVARTPRIAATTLAEQMASTAPPQLLEIRADKERRDKFIEEACIYPRIIWGTHGELPRPPLAHCAGGIAPRLQLASLSVAEIQMFPSCSGDCSLGEIRTSRSRTNKPKE